MPYALQLYFDPVADATVRNLWRRLAQTGVPPHLHASARRSHRTLAVYGDLDVVEAERELGSFVAALAPFPLIFSHVGNSPGIRWPVRRGYTTTGLAERVHVLTSQSTIRTPSTGGHDYETGQSSRYATIALTGSRSARR